MDGSQEWFNNYYKAKNNEKSSSNLTKELTKRKVSFVKNTA